MGLLLLKANMVKYHRVPGTQKSQHIDSRLLKICMSLISIYFVPKLQNTKVLTLFTKAATNARGKARSPSLPRVFRDNDASGSAQNSLSVS